VFIDHGGAVVEREEFADYRFPQLIDFGLVIFVVHSRFPCGANRTEAGANANGNSDFVPRSSDLNIQRTVHWIFL
jgi:hypothetical protein